MDDKKWKNGEIEKEFKQIEEQTDLDLRKKGVDHFVSKRYLNIFWGEEYQHDLS